MSRLLLDVGNSRVKYALDGPMGARPHDGRPAAVVAAVLDGCDPAVEVALVDVTGTAVGVMGGRRYRRLEPSASACGVHNAYAEPARLGADRWAALIGARAGYPGDCVVVDAGSALTVDLLAADGRHRGGWIAPGLRLSIAALAAGTRFARAADADEWTGGPAADTGAAIRAGALDAALGLVERARRAAGDARVLVTGGDGERIAAGLDGAEWVDDLVLRGLAAWAAHP